MGVVGTARRPRRRHIRYPRTQQTPAAGHMIFCVIYVEKKNNPQEEGPFICGSGQPAGFIEGTLEGSSTMRANSISQLLDQ